MIREAIEKLIFELIDRNVNDFARFNKAQRQISKEFKFPFFSNDELQKVYHSLIQQKRIVKNETLEKLIRLKSTRSLSGIVVVSVLTKPYDCPGKCLYCPTEKNVPKSYLSNEPAVMRAMLCDYDPYRQTKLRLEALKSIGHKTSKINIRVIGGTWSYYSPQYQTWFIKEVFRAANEDYQTSLKSTKLSKLQTTNEHALHRIVEISIETRQDYINKNEIKRLRLLGVTKVELGVQSVYDEVLKTNRRGHDIEQTKIATNLLKDAGFKVSYQVMLNLPGSSLAMDEQMFEQLFNNTQFKPDHLKIYPLALLKEAPIYQLYRKNKFKPYNKEELTNVLVKIKAKIPPYCRIERVIRDIPASSIVEGGAKVSNLRQIATEAMKKANLQCQCIRCQEIKSRFDKNEKYKLMRRDYDASGGKEIFLSIESTDGKQLVSFLRLRIPSQFFTGQTNFLPVLNNSAIIREIHTYGPQLEIGERDLAAAQHQGFGKKLIAEAEKIVKKEFNLSKISVIAGVGTREYFSKLNYFLDQTYMTKIL